MSDTTVTTEAASETSADSTEATATEATTEQAQAPEVRDPAALLSAYEAEKGKRKEQDKTLREIREEFEAFKAKAEGKEAEYTAAQEAQRIKDEALAAANERILKAELRAAAKGKLTDPTDVFRFPEHVDLSAFEVGANGEVDSAALEAAVTNLITKRPDLAAQGGQRFQGTADGGARNDATTKPSQLSKADVDRLSKERKYDEIEKARSEGRLADYLAS